MELLVATGLVSLSYLLTRRYYIWKCEEIMRHNRIATSGYIYAIQLIHGHRTLVKIGRSIDPIKRIRALRTSAPYGIKVLGVIPVLNDVASEAYIHKRFKHLRISKAGEWFTLSIPLLLYIRTVSDPLITARVQKAVERK